MGDVCGYPCEIITADFEANTVTLSMTGEYYKVGAGPHWLIPQPEVIDPPLPSMQDLLRDVLQRLTDAADSLYSSESPRDWEEVRLAVNAARALLDRRP